jgi:pyruvate/2-oxoglutarate dehydrogenase complex dihydrolipoamide dehydrogenase (E3) component
MSAPEGWRLPYARRLREATGVPVIGVGQIRTPETAEAALRDGDCDLVALGRPSLTDPEWPNKAQTGRGDLIRPCTTCNFCIATENLHRICCAENPQTGRELDAPIPADLGRGRKAAVVGGGPGGMTAALMLSGAGFETHLYESRALLGGGLVASGTPPGKDFLLRYRDYLTRQLDDSDVVQHRGRAVDGDELATLGPDVTVIATGTSAREHPIERRDEEMVAEAFDLLMQDIPDPFDHGDHVVVYGGGETGCEAAEYAAARGASVTLVTRSRRDQLARSAEVVYRTNLLRRLNDHPRVTILDNHHIVAVGDGRVTIVSADGERAELEARCLLLAQGREPERKLADALVAQGLSVHLVGDGRKTGRIGDAVRDSYFAMQAIAARYGETVPINC